MFDHQYLHAALGSTSQSKFVHEAANEKDASPIPLEKILRRAAIWQAIRIEAHPFVAHTNRDAGITAVVESCELDVYPLALIIIIAVRDGVNHRLADRNVDPVHGLIAEPGGTAEAVTNGLDKIEHVQGAADVEANGATVGH